MNDDELKTIESRLNKIEQKVHEIFLLCLIIAIIIFVVLGYVGCSYLKSMSSGQSYYIINGKPYY